MINFDINRSRDWGQITMKETREEVNISCNIGKVTGGNNSGA